MTVITSDGPPEPTPDGAAAAAAQQPGSQSSELPLENNADAPHSDANPMVQDTDTATVAADATNRIPADQASDLTSGRSDIGDPSINPGKKGPVEHPTAAAGICQNHATADESGECDPDAGWKEEKRRLLLTHLSAEPPDVEALRAEAVSRGGLLDDALRRRIWPLLLRAEGPAVAAPAMSDEEVCAHPYHRQVVLDVERTLKRFPPGIEDSVRFGMQESLVTLIVRSLAAHPELHYYQGYHDVACIFLSTLAGNNRLQNTCWRGDDDSNNNNNSGNNTSSRSLDGSGALTTTTGTTSCWTV